MTRLRMLAHAIQLVYACLRWLPSTALRRANVVTEDLDKLFVKRSAGGAGSGSGASGGAGGSGRAAGS